METKLDESELWSNKLTNSLKNRIEETIDFIKPYGEIADCGENNPMKEAIEKHFNCIIDSIDWNFNENTSISKKYDTILCFEVIEHVMNPLLFLEQLKKLLKKDGIIYLSTPYQFPQILKAIHHYHEIPTDRLMWLFSAAKLKIIESGKLTIAGNWYNHINGIRPFLRYFQKTRIYKITKLF